MLKFFSSLTVAQLTFHFIHIKHMFQLLRHKLRLQFASPASFIVLVLCVNMRQRYKSQFDLKFYVIENDVCSMSYIWFQADNMPLLSFENTDEPGVFSCQYRIIYKYNLKTIVKFIYFKNCLFPNYSQSSFPIWLSGGHDM